MKYTPEELSRLQTLEVEMLVAFVDICKKLELHYYIVGGTLLGAVRHKGFIPWDDDIDIAMPRSDYEMFQKKAPAMLPRHMIVQNYRTEEESYINYTKIRNVHTTFVEKHCREHAICHGVFIDIFPLDNYTNNPLKKCWYKIKRKLLSHRIAQIYTWDVAYSPIKELVKRPLSWIWPDVKKAVVQREKLYTSFRNQDLWINHSGAYGDREIAPVQWYGEGCDLLFEGIVVKAPKEYRKWLTQVYGEYMQLPPVEKRVSQHHTALFDLGKSYMEYDK